MPFNAGPERTANRFYRSALRALAACSALTLVPTASLAHPHVWVGTKSVFIFENGALSALRFTWLFDEMYSASAIEGLDKNNDGQLDSTELEELTKINIDGLKEFDYFTTARSGSETAAFDAPRDYAMELLEVDEGPGPQLVAGPTSPSPSAADTKPKGFWARIGGWFSGLFTRSPSKTTVASPAPPVVVDKVKVLALHMTLPLKKPVAAADLRKSTQGFQYVLNDAQMYIWFEPMPKDGIALSPGAPGGCRITTVDPEQDEEQRKLAEAFGRAGSMSISASGKSVMLTCSED